MTLISETKCICILNNNAVDLSLRQLVPTKTKRLIGESHCVFGWTTRPANFASQAVNIQMERR